MGGGALGTVSVCSVADGVGVKALLERARAGLDERIKTRLQLAEDDDLGRAELLRRDPSPTGRFLSEVVLADDDPLDVHFGFLFDDTDYKFGYLTVVGDLSRAQERPVPARVVFLQWRGFHGPNGAREAAERIYNAIEQVAAAS